MNATTVAEILEQARALEAAAGECCRKLAERSGDRTVRHLAGWLGRHYRRLSKMLAELTRGQYASLRDVPIPYGPTPVAFRHVEHMDLPPDAAAEDVLAAALRMDEGLTTLFRQVLQQDVAAEVRELFEALVRREEADQAELRKLRGAGTAV